MKDMKDMLMRETINGTKELPRTITNEYNLEGSNASLIGKFYHIQLNKDGDICFDASISKHECYMEIEKKSIFSNKTTPKLTEKQTWNVYTFYSENTALSAVSYHYQCVYTTLQNYYRKKLAEKASEKSLKIDPILMSLVFGSLDKIVEAFLK
ncbi:MAG: hypothetical protein KKH40_05450 [Nanoarchaeota archaeon]|nr:hypothetical protein [Nanoarchaeota archaeon]